MRETLVEVNGMFHTGPTKTHAGKRTVSVPPSLLDVLAVHIKAYQDPDGYVFSAAQGGRIRRSNWERRTFHPACERAGLAVPELNEQGQRIGWKIPPPRIHDLRHTAVALAIAAGAHPKAIQTRLGHSSITTTLDRYGHLFEQLDEELADRLDAIGRDRARA